MSDRDARQNLRFPNKLFFKIGEVCELAGVEPYVLRFWETEFPNLAPAEEQSRPSRLSKEGRRDGAEDQRTCSTIAASRSRAPANSCRKRAPIAEPDRDKVLVAGPQRAARHLDFASNGKPKVDYIGT